MRPHGLACAISIVGLLCAPGVVRAQFATSDKAGGAGWLPLTIPIFPLQDVMLFPTISRPLHIFEPRYRAMVADALKGDRIIGMVLLRAGYEAEYEGRPPVYPIGCAGVITDAEELPDGRYVIVLRGLVKFRVTSEDGRRPYRLARVEALSEVPDDEQRAALRRQRSRLTSLLAEVAAPGSEPPSPASLHCVCRWPCSRAVGAGASTVTLAPHNGFARESPGCSSSARCNPPRRHAWIRAPRTIVLAAESHS